MLSLLCAAGAALHPAATHPCSCLQQKIADRKSKMLCVQLDDLRDVSVMSGDAGRQAPADICVSVVAGAQVLCQQQRSTGSNSWQQNAPQQQCTKVASHSRTRFRLLRSLQECRTRSTPSTSTHTPTTNPPAPTVPVPPAWWRPHHARGGEEQHAPLHQCDC